MSKLKPCPFCGGQLEIFIHDDTNSRFCDGCPCWRFGATCPQCGIGIDCGSGLEGLPVEDIENYVIVQLNRRPTYQQKADD